MLEPSRETVYLKHGILVSGKVICPSVTDVQIPYADELRIERPTATAWQVTLEHLASLGKLIPHLLLRMRFLQFRLKVPWSHGSDPPYLPVPVTQEEGDVLTW